MKLTCTFWDASHVQAEVGHGCMCTVTLNLKVVRYRGSIGNRGCGFPCPTVSFGYEVGRGFTCSFRASESFRKEEMLFLPRGKWLTQYGLGLVKLVIPFPQWWGVMFSLLGSFPSKHGVSPVAKGETDGLLRLARNLHHTHCLQRFPGPHLPVCVVQPLLLLFF